MQTRTPYKILVVDDNLLNLKLIEKSLSKEGYTIITETDGTRGRHAAFRERPDLILLDIQMPGETGFEVITHLKNNADTSTIPVIFLTGVSEVTSKLKGFELGAVDYITKPFHSLEVLARVRLHLKLSIATNSLIEDQARRLRQVAEAQTSMLPLPEDLPGASFGVYYKALEEAGGDFYDIFRISDNIFGYFLADFSGHDIKTSYMTASLKALLAQNCTPVYSPEESMKMLNDVLIRILPGGKFLTACYIHLNRGTRQLTVVNAGHPPIVYLPRAGDPYLIKTEGDILGTFKDARFGKQTIEVCETDRFFMYSDGLVESAENKVTWPRGAEDLLPVIEKTRSANLENAPGCIVESIFNTNTAVEDDVTVICVEV
ncbi:MAG: PP2C family protein-serine/threonine phosphatase [Thermodesulfobacteriota bacterium]